MSRHSVAWLVGLAVMVAIGGYLSSYLKGDRVSSELTLVLVEGEVYLTSGSQSGMVTKAGTVLGTDDRIVTHEASRAVLGLGRETRIRLGPTSSVQVKAVDVKGVHLELEHGALEALVRPESGAVRVGNSGREVQATNGAFSLGVHEGAMVVNATEGDLMLQGVDAARIAEGSSALITSNHADIGPISDELLLSVVWPEMERTRSEDTTIQGVTAPRAQITVSGPFGTLRTRANGAGEFVLEVPLSEGNNPVKVTAKSLMGEEVQQDGSLPTRDTTGPTFRGGVEYGP
jgi:hypothetical protein